MELGAEHRRASEPTDAFGPSPAHPLRVVEDRLHPLHLGDVVVERARKGIGRRELVRVGVEPLLEIGTEVGDVHCVTRAQAYLAATGEAGGRKRHMR